MLPKITGSDTWDHFIGSGATSYPWYDIVTHDAPETDVWVLSFADGCEETEEPGTVYVLDHKRIMRAASMCARALIRYRGGTTLPAWCADVSLETLRQCALFLADPEYADFDADTADQVMQVCAFGRVIYG